MDRPHPSAASPSTGSRDDRETCSDGQAAAETPCSQTTQPLCGAFGTPRAWNAQSGPLQDESQQTWLARGLSSPWLSGLGEGVD